MKINPDDDDITKAEKYKYNSMVVKKKPYFFIYLYQILMDEYKCYEKNFNSICFTQFGIPIKELLRKETHTDAELSLIRKYRKYSPVLETDCVMNKLCKEIENVEYDIKFHPNANSLLLNFVDFSDIKLKAISKLEDICKEYKINKRYKMIETMVENEGVQIDEVCEVLKSVVYSNKDECREKMIEIFSSSKDLFNHLMYLCKKNNWAYDCVWDILGEDIIPLIPYGETLVPVEDENGYEYLGRHYSLTRVETIAL